MVQRNTELVNFLSRQNEQRDTIDLAKAMSKDQETVSFLELLNLSQRVEYKENRLDTNVSSFRSPVPPQQERECMLLLE